MYIDSNGELSLMPKSKFGNNSFRFIFNVKIWQQLFQIHLQLFAIFHA